MQNKIFFKQRKKNFNIIQIFFVFILLFLIIIFFIHHFGLYDIDKDSIASFQPIKKIFKITHAKKISSQIKFNADQHITSKRKKEYLKLKKNIQQAYYISDPSFLIKFVSEKETTCFDILFLRGKKISNGTLFAFPWSLERKEHFLYTGLAFTEYLQKNKYLSNISTLIYDGSPKCSDVAKSIESFFPNQKKPEKIIIYYPSRANYHIWFHHVHGTYFSSLLWRKILPIKYQQTFLQSLSSVAMPFMSHPGSNLSEEISSITIGYKNKTNFSNDLLHRSIIATNNLIAHKEKLINQGPWLSGDIALKSNSLDFLILGSLLFLLTLIWIRFLNYKNKLDYFPSIIALVYFSLPCFLFLFLLQLFSAGDSISFTLSLTALCIALGLSFFLKKISITFFNIRHNIILTSIILVFFLITSFFSWPFFSFLVSIIVILYLTIKKVSTLLSYSIILTILISVVWVITQLYEFSTLANYILTPLRLSKTLTSSFFVTVYNILFLGSIITLLTGSQEV